MRNLLKSKKLFLVIFLTLAILGFVFYVFSINKESRKMEIYNEVTFMGPRQAVIFWKTKEETLGFVKYGETRFRREGIETQTSSEPGETHAVFLENIPLEGLYISIHNESDSFLIFPKVFKIQYGEEALIYE